MSKERKLRPGDPIYPDYINDKIGDIEEGVVCEVFGDDYYAFAYCDKRDGQVKLAQMAGTTFMPYSLPDLQERLKRFQTHIEKVEKDCHRTHRTERPLARRKKFRGR